MNLGHIHGGIGDPPPPPARRGGGGGQGVRTPSNLGGPRERGPRRRAGLGLGALCRGAEAARPGAKALRFGESLGQLGGEAPRMVAVVFLLVPKQKQLKKGGLSKKDKGHGGLNKSSTRDPLFPMGSAQFLLRSAAGNSPNAGLTGPKRIHPPEALRQFGQGLGGILSLCHSIV